MGFNKKKKVSVILTEKFKEIAENEKAEEVRKQIVY